MNIHAAKIDWKKVEILKKKLGNTIRKHRNNP